MSLMKDIKGFVGKFVKSPLKTSIVAYLIWKILKPHSEGMNFPESIKILHKDQDKELIQDTETGVCAIIQGTDAIYFKDKDAAISAFGGEKMKKLERLHREAWHYVRTADHSHKCAKCGADADEIWSDGYKTKAFCSDHTPKEECKKENYGASFETKKLGGWIKAKLFFTTEEARDEWMRTAAMSDYFRNIKKESVKKLERIHREMFIKESMVKSFKERQRFKEQDDFDLDKLAKKEPEKRTHDKSLMRQWNSQFPRSAVDTNLQAFSDEIWWYRVGGELMWVPADIIRGIRSEK